MDRLKIFISYAKENIEQVKELYYMLKIYGFDPWLDENELMPGQEWQLELESNIEKSDIVLVCLSKFVIKKRGYIQKEIRVAIDKANYFPEGVVFIIPVRLEDCDVPNSLKSKQWVNLHETDGYKILFDTLRQISFKKNKSNKPKTKNDRISGVYRAIGNNEDGETYEGRVIIIKQGDQYKVLWNISDDRWESTGILHGNELIVEGDFNFTYSIRNDKSLYGEWEPGLFETLMPIKG